MCTDRSTSPSLRPLLVLIVLFGAGACGAAEDARHGWRGTVDTTASGFEVVRNPRAGLWDSATAWRIVERVRIGSMEGEGPDLFGNVRSVEADRRGRIYVLEAQARAVRVFGPDGTFIRSFGRSGSGPGEFDNPIGTFFGPDGRLWVADPGNARYSVFDTSGTYVTAYRRPAGFFRLPFPGGFDPSGRLVDVGLDAGPGDEALLAFRPGAEAAPDTMRLPSFRADRFEIASVMSTVVPFSPKLIWRFDPRGYLWHGITGSYRIVQQRFMGDTVRVIERPSDHLPVTDEEREQAVADLAWFTRQGGKVDPGRIPDRKPAWQDLFTDDRGYLWVRPTTVREERDRRFDIFDPRGRYLGRARSDVALWTYRPVVVRGRWVYAVTTDELQVQYVVRAEILGRDEMSSARE